MTETKEPLAYLDKVEEKARRLMDKGKWREAIALFVAARPFIEGREIEPSFYNNWALCHEQLGEYEKALEVLAPNLDPGAIPSAFAHGLAARLLYKLGREEEALAQLREGIEDFAAVLDFFRQTKTFPPKGFREYLIVLQEVAGILGRHRTVLELHKRWQSLYVSPHNWFLAGVAAFNLGRYRQASDYWWLEEKPQEWRFLDDYRLVAEEVESGLIPPFPLPYQPMVPEEMKKKIGKMKNGEECGLTGAEIASLLGYLLANGFKNQAVLTGLVRYSGAWGERFARSLLLSNRIERDVKFAAVSALVESGRVAPGEPLPAIVDGRPQTITVQSLEVREGDEEAAAVWQEAKKLRDAGRTEEAERLLHGLIERGIFFPPAMLTLANLLRQREAWEEAEALLSTLEELDPENPRILFNLAAFHLQRGDVEKAREYFRRIEPSMEDEDFQEKCRLLGEQIFQAALSASILTDAPRILREIQEERPISLGLTLLQGLRRHPPEWLTAACMAYGLEPARRKEERVKQLHAHIITDPGRALKGLSPKARECLRHLLGEGGWARLDLLEERFGSISEDGFYWSKEPPRSPLGELRLRGLAYIGRAKDEGGHKVAVVPEDLRGAIGKCLGG
ncbi:MAG: tetratricopeptide repeat protein [Bacillota bacterium]